MPKAAPRICIRRALHAAEDLGEEWRSLASIEAQHTESIQQALLACTNALTTPLVAVESEIDAAGEAIRNLDGGGEWTEFGRSTSEMLQGAQVCVYYNGGSALCCPRTRARKHAHVHSPHLSNLSLSLSLSLSLVVRRSCHPLPCPPT